MFKVGDKVRIDVRGVTENNDKLFANEMHEHQGETYCIYEVRDHETYGQIYAIETRSGVWWWRGRWLHKPKPIIKQLEI